jgi:Domain of unknown function (DUF4272)
VTPHSDSPSEELEDVPRGAEEIARRTLILSAVIACAYGADKRATVDWFTSQKLWTDVSPEEKAFLTGEPTSQAQIDMTWRIEALVPLLWALRKIDAMPSLAQQFDTTEAVKTLVFPPASIAVFVAAAALRSEAEIKSEYEKVYDAHWRVRDAQLSGKAPPLDVNAGVVRERHHAFNWIIGYGNQTWDEVATDT